MSDRHRRQSTFVTAAPVLAASMADGVCIIIDFVQSGAQGAEYNATFDSTALSLTPAQ